MKARTSRLTSRDTKALSIKRDRFWALLSMSLICCDEDRSLEIITPRSRVYETTGSVQLLMLKLGGVDRLLQIKIFVYVETPIRIVCGLSLTT